jgi:hypothetical protein
MITIRRERDVEWPPKNFSREIHKELSNSMRGCYYNISIPEQLRITVRIDTRRKKSGLRLETR